MLKPQDIVVVLKVHNLQDLEWTYSELAHSLHMSSSEVHAALKRCDASGLYDCSSRKVKQHCLLEFLIHGLKYVFPSQPGALSRGIPTAHSAEPLKNLLNVNPSDVYVWSHPHGTVRGQSILDVMPADTSILSFSNPWYKSGLKKSIIYHLAIGQEINIFPVTYLLASKIEAFNS